MFAVGQHVEFTRGREYVGVVAQVTPYEVLVRWRGGLAFWYPLHEVRACDYCEVA